MPCLPGQLRHGVQSGIVPDGPRGQKEIRTRAGMGGQQHAAHEKPRPGKVLQTGLIVVFRARQTSEGKRCRIFSKSGGGRAAGPFVARVGKPRQKHALHAERRQP